MSTTLDLIEEGLACVSCGRHFHELDEDQAAGPSMCVECQREQEEAWIREANEYLGEEACRGLP